jgi:hypothetical protein
VSRPPLAAGTACGTGNPTCSKQRRASRASSLHKGNSAPWCASPALIERQLLLAVEFVGLSIGQGEAEYAQLAVFADFELREPAQPWAHACCDHGSEPPARQHMEREVIAVPGRERDLGSSLLQLEDERVALRPQHGLAENRTAETAGQRPLVRTRYDDGGYSGGSTERPALQRLLADIRDRRIDVVVV